MEGMRALSVKRERRERGGEGGKGALAALKALQSPRGLSGSLLEDHEKPWDG